MKGLSKIFLPIFMILFVHERSFGQCPIASFEVSDTLCVNEYLIIKNESINSNYFEWDFCAGDLLLDPTAEIISTISESSAPIAIDVAYDANNWYGFIASRNNNSIIRLDFGTSLDNTPTLQNLGNIDDLLDNPQAIKIRKDNGDWYLFVQNKGTNELIRVNLGAYIENNTPSADTILSSSGIFNNGFDIRFDGTDWVLVLGKGAAITLVNFGNSLANAIQPEDIMTSPNFTSINNISDVSLLDYQGDWYAFISAYGSKTIHKLEFGTSLFHLPTSTPLNNSFLGSDAPYGIFVTQEDSLIVSFISTLGGNLYKLTLDNIDATGNGIQIGKLGVLSNTLKMAFAKDGSNWRGFMLNYSSKQLFKINFPNNCSANFSTSNAYSPDNIYYYTPGNYSVELIANNDAECSQRSVRHLNVRNSSSPIISFMTDNICLANTNQFTATSSDDASISAWKWDFGDGNAGTGQNVNHQYATDGTYEVSLQVDATNQCSNTSKKTIPIFPTPQPDFTYTSGQVCSNNPVDFTNNTQLFGADTLVQYLWNFNGEYTSTATDTSFTFTTGGDKNVSLKASIPGCEATVSKTVNITPGPSTNFTWSQVCQYEPFQFNNVTTGDNVTGYQWDFDDGYFSQEITPIHNFTDGGDYNISLSATNALGCETTIVKPVPVRFKPNADFTNELACANNQVLFLDQSTVEDANISSWNWTIVDGQGNSIGSATNKDPVLFMDKSGTYLTKLIVSSNYGCLDTLSKNVEVLPSPQADFMASNLCDKDSTIFTSTALPPEQGNIIANTWLIDNNIFTQPEVKYRFSSTGEKQVTLIVKSDNLCENSIVKNIKIQPTPTVDFSTVGKCDNENVLFSSTSPATEDTVVSYEWKLGNQTISFEKEFVYQFSAAETYNVKLIETTKNKCNNSIQKNITIYPAPVAAFTAYPESGAPPLQVDFTNNSSGANSFWWHFESGATSAVKNPTHTYESLGDKFPTLVASNDYGCRDTSDLRISVVVPELDLVLENVSVINDQDKLEFYLKIRNAGSLIVENVDVQVDFAGQASVIEPVSTYLHKGESITHKIGFSLVQMAGKNTDYVCFTLIPHSGEYEEMTPVNNTACVELDHDLRMLNPYPNPTRDHKIYVPFILPEGGSVSLDMFNSTGALVFNQKYQTLQPGLNIINLELNQYQSGIYILTLNFGMQKVVKKIAIQ